MKLTVAEFTFDLSLKPKSIAITLDFEGEQPNHFGAQKAQAMPMQSGDFVGDTKQGGSCNAQDVYLNPHCNGTHTESISHIVDEVIAPFEVIEQSLILARLVTIRPESEYKGVDSYQPPLENHDQIISKDLLTSVITSLHKEIKALVIRTLPNQKAKQSYQYGDEIQPPFFTNEAMQWLTEETKIEHLLVDMPSVDRLYDDGLLSNHRLFWHVDAGCHQLKDNQHQHKTITEMVYVDSQIPDGIYLLNLQTPKLKLNAVPSHPVLYAPTENC